MKSMCQGMHDRTCQRDGVTVGASEDGAGARVGAFPAAKDVSHGILPACQRRLIVSIIVSRAPMGLAAILKPSASRRRHDGDRVRRARGYPISRPVASVGGRIAFNYINKGRGM